MSNLLQWIESSTTQWIDDGNYRQWIGLSEEVTSSGLNQVYTDLNYIYTATSSGVNIYNIESEKLTATLPYTNGFNSVCGNDHRLYLATYGDGIKYIEKTCVSGNDNNPYNLISCLNNYDDFTITSNYVRYVNCTDDLLMCCTNVGVDVIASGVLGHYRTHSLSTVDAYKCFITSTGKSYYTVVSGSYETVDVINNTSSNWPAPDKRWYIGGDILPPEQNINDIFITEGTATNNYNTLFIATSSGSYVIDEYSSQYIKLTSMNDNTIAIWADSDTSLSGGLVYVATDASFSVVNLIENSIYDYYTSVDSGRYGDTLISASGIVDITTSSI